MANLGVDFDWATVTKTLILLWLIISIYHATSRTKLNVKYQQLHTHHSTAHWETCNVQTASDNTVCNCVNKLIRGTHHLVQVLLILLSLLLFVYTLTIVVAGGRVTQSV